MAPKIEQVFTRRASLGKEDTLPLGSVKGGAHRFVVPVTGGFIKGSDFEAEILSDGGDWLHLDPVTGTSHLDVRFQARSSSGDMIYGHYPGVFKMDSYVQTLLGWKADEGTTKATDHYFFTTRIFEVSSERLEWMEQHIFLSHGHFHVENGTQSVEDEV